MSATKRDDSKLIVVFGAPSTGWLPLQVSSQHAAIELNASSVPDDFVADLITALGSVAIAQGRSSAIANEEPTKVEVAFLRTGPRMELRIHRQIRDGETFVFEGPASDVIIPFWRALRRLQHDQDFAQWRWPFPVERMNRLSELVGDIKSDADRS